MGLASYGVHDSRRYHGRDRAARAVSRLLETARFAGVIGASGSGKSSLLAAGLGALGWDVVVVRPTGDEPIGPDVTGSDRAVLVVDQLEELFTGGDHDARARYLDALCDLHDSGVAVAIALRSDHYGTCAGYPRFAELIARNNLLLGPPSVEDLRTMVVGPALDAGLVVPADLVDEIVDEVLGEPAALPLVSHALAETYRLSTSTGELEWDAYRRSGGVRGAIATTAETAWLALPASRQTTARSLLTQLAEPDAGGIDTARRVPLAALVGDIAERRATLDALATARLVAIDGASAEIAHEAVFREWPRLRDWLEADRARLRSLANLRNAARWWRESGHDEAALLRGSQLVTARDAMSAGADDDPDRSVSDFVAASQDLAEQELDELRGRELAARRSNRRLRVLLAAVVALGLGAAGVGLVAAHQTRTAEHERDVADARRLAAASGTLRSDNVDLAALLAAEAYDLHADRGTAGAMLAAMTARPGLQAYLHDDTAFTTVAVGDHGRFLAADTSTTTIGTWVLSADSPRWSGDVELPDGEEVSKVVSHDDVVLIGGIAGRVHAWSTSTGQFLWHAAPVEAPVTALAAAGDLVVVGDETGAIAVLDVRTGAPVAQVAAGGDDGSAIVSVAFEARDDDESADALVAGTIGGAVLVARAPDWTGHEVAAIDAEVWSVALGPKAGWLAVGTDADLRFLDPVTGAQDGLSIDAHGGIVLSMVVLDDGVLVTGGEDGKVQFWDAVTRRSPRPALDAHASGVIAMAVDGARLATAGDDLRLGVWNLDLASLVASPIDDVDADVAGVAIAADGLAVSAGRDGTVRFTRSDGASAGPPIALSAEPLTAVAVTADGRTVVAVDEGGSLWIIRGVGQVTTIEQRSVGSRSTSVALDPTGRWLAAVETDGDCDACTVLLDLSTPGEPIRLRSAGLAAGAPARPAYAVAFSPDGSALVTADNGGNVDRWALGAATPTSMWHVKLERGVRSLAVSHDGSLLAIGANGGTLLITSMVDGSELQRLDGHRGRVGGVAFSPDDRLLASTGADDRSLRLWEVTSGLPYGTAILTGANWVAMPAWEPSDPALVVATAWGGPMRFDLDPDRMRSDLCGLAQRNLTEREWRQYVGSRQPYSPTCPAIVDG